jgi:uncharacterized protein DUF4232
MNASDKNQENPRDRHLALRHPAGRGIGALAVAVCSVALVSGCASPAPTARVAAGKATPTATTAAPADTTSPLTRAGAGGITSSPGAAGSSGTSGPGSAVPRCKNLDVGLTGVQPPHKDRFGHYQYPLRLTVTNFGTASCSVYGYPGLGLLDSSHHALPPSQTHWGPTYFARDPGPSLIALAPRQSAQANIALGWRRTPWAAYLEITPPGEYHHDLTSIPMWLEAAGMEGGLGGDLTATAMTRAPTQNCRCR